MPEANGHAPQAIAEASASAAELDALLIGLFEPVQFELAPGRVVEIRPLMLDGSDRLYGGGLTGGALQRFLLARCVFINGKPLGDDNVARLPVALANRLAPVVMSANGMADQAPAAEGEGPTDPKA